MNRIILSVMLLFASSTFVLAQSDKEQAVRQALAKVETALGNNDADAYAPLLSEDYMNISPMGKMNKTERVELIRSGRVSYESLAFKDVKININKDTAVVKATVNSKMTGADATSAPVSLTFVKHGDLWLLAIVQLASAKESK
jgi:ketosteroid isomerase-like protein